MRIKLAHILMIDINSCFVNHSLGGLMAEYVKADWIQSVFNTRERLYDRMCADERKTKGLERLPRHFTERTGPADRGGKNNHQRDREGGQAAERANGHPDCPGAGNDSRGDMGRWKIERHYYLTWKGCWSKPRRSSCGSCT